MKRRKKRKIKRRRIKKRVTKKNEKKSKRRERIERTSKRARVGVLGLYESNLCIRREKSNFKTLFYFYFL
jgi:hypothetical protein